MSDEQATIPKTKGYKSTEFWLSSVAAIAGLLLASGILIEGSQVAQIVGGVVSVLATLGYTKGRSDVKAALIKEEK